MELITDENLQMMKEQYEKNYYKTINEIFLLQKHFDYDEFRLNKMESHQFNTFLKLDETCSNLRFEHLLHFNEFMP